MPTASSGFELAGGWKPPLPKQNRLATHKRGDQPIFLCFTQEEVVEAVEHLKKAVDLGMLSKKIYGWWWYKSITERNLVGFSKQGIPLSPDLLFYVSHQEANNILTILEEYKKGRLR